MNGGRKVQEMRDHTHYIQGVSWDPCDVFLASQSSDRSVRLYKRIKKDARVGKFRCNAIIQRKQGEKKETAQDMQTDETTKEFSYKLFLDENVNSFFRRCAWSPEGTLFIAPAGVYIDETTHEASNVTYIFSRYNFSK